MFCNAVCNLLLCHGVLSGGEITAASVRFSIMLPHPQHISVYSYVLKCTAQTTAWDSNKRERKKERIHINLIIDWRQKIQFWKIIACFYVCFKPELLTRYKIHVINLIQNIRCNNVYLKTQVGFGYHWMICPKFVVLNPLKDRPACKSTGTDKESLFDCV